MIPSQFVRLWEAKNKHKQLADKLPPAVRNTLHSSSRDDAERSRRSHEKATRGWLEVSAAVGMDSCDGDGGDLWGNAHRHGTAVADVNDIALAETESVPGIHSYLLSGGKVKHHKVFALYGKDRS